MVTGVDELCLSVDICAGEQMVKLSHYMSLDWLELTHLALP